LKVSIEHVVVFSSGGSWFQARGGGSDWERPVAEPESSSTDEVVAVCARAHRPRRDVGSWCQHVRHQLNCLILACVSCQWLHFAIGWLKCDVFRCKQRARGGVNSRRTWASSRDRCSPPPLAFRHANKRVRTTLPVLESTFAHLV